jgi:hypothetical protein
LFYWLNLFDRRVRVVFSCSASRLDHVIDNNGRGVLQVFGPCGSAWISRKNYGMVGDAEEDTVHGT